MITTSKKESFYKAVRRALFGGKLLQRQVDGLEAILHAWNASGLTDLRWLAYMLATAYHETGATMQPIEEWGKGAGKDYGKKLKMGGGPGKRKPYSEPDKLYYGRGYVQLTWYENYLKMGKLLGIDLLNYPELACLPDVAAAIMFEGMTTGKSFKGDFTGHHLAMYFTAKKEDPVGARKIINGKDKAELIAGYYYVFKTALL